MRTARSLPYRRGSPWTENPLDREPPFGQRAPLTETSPTDAPWTNTLQTDTPPTETKTPMWTDTRENITLPQASFAGGNDCERAEIISAKFT